MRLLIWDADHCQVAGQGEGTDVGLVRAQRLALGSLLRDQMCPWNGLACRAPERGSGAARLLQKTKCNLRYNLFCLDCSFTFNDEALPQRKRPAKHEFLLCISKEVDAKGALLSAFSDSALFHRHHISGWVEPLQTNEYVNPLITNLEFGAGHRAGNNPSLSEEALLKQWITGVAMYSKAGPPFNIYSCKGFAMLCMLQALSPQAKCRC